MLGVESGPPDSVTLRLLVKTAPGAQFRLQRALRRRSSAASTRPEIQVRPVAATGTRSDGTAAGPSVGDRAMMTP